MCNKNILRIPRDINFIRVEEIPMMIAHALRPTKPGDQNDLDWSHAASEDFLVRSVTAKDHVEYLQQAIRSGELIVRNQFSRIPDPGAVGDRLNNALVDVSDLALYVAQFGIQVVSETGKPMMEAVETTSSKAGNEAPVAPADRRAWTLKKPRRFQGYRQPLYNYLKSAFEAGAECPSPYDVLDAFRKHRPSEIYEVLSEGIKYQGAKGTKEANINAIRKAIDLLVDRHPHNRDD